MSLLARPHSLCISVFFVQAKHTIPFIGIHSGRQCAIVIANAAHPRDLANRTCAPHRSSQRDASPQFQDAPVAEEMHDSRSVLALGAGGLRRLLDSERRADALPLCPSAPGQTRCMPDFRRFMHAYNDVRVRLGTDVTVTSQSCAANT